MNIFKWFLALFILTQSFGGQRLNVLPMFDIWADIPKASANIISSNDEGYQIVDFNNNLQGVTSWYNLLHDPIGGTIKASNAWGYVYLSSITPTSFSSWKNLEIKYFGNNNNFYVEIYKCSGTWSLFITSPSIPVNGIINLSGLVNPSIPCINIVIWFDDAVASIDSVKVSWQPKPVLQTTISWPSERRVCEQQVQYTVQYALNYVDDTNVVLYVPLPNSQTGTVTGYTNAYNQFPGKNPQFISALDWWQYTTSAISILGKSIPANSVYWAFPTLSKGTTKVTSFKINTPCGTQNGVDYIAKSYIDWDQSELAIAPIAAKTNLISTNQPEISKKPKNVADFRQCYPNNPTLGTFRIYPTIQPEVTYEVKVRNAKTPNSEDLFNPTVEDNLSDLATKLNTQCGGATLSSRVSNISNGGTLVGNKIVWNGLGSSWTGRDVVTSIETNPEYTFTYDVDFSGCSTSGVQFTNNVSLLSDNGNTVSTQVIVKSDDVQDAECLYSKGHFGNMYYMNEEITKKNSLEQQPGNDQVNPNSLSYGETFSYTFLIDNQNPVRVDNMLISDVLPSEVEFVSASLSAPMGLTNASPSFSGSMSGWIYYTDQTILPAFDTWRAYLGLSITGWSMTNFGTNTKALIFAPKCINSPINPVPAGNDCYGAPSSRMGNIKVKLKENGNACTDSTISNRGNFSAYQIGDATSTDAWLSSFYASTSDNTDIIVKPRLGHFLITQSSGTSDIDAPANGTYFWQIKNDGKDSIVNGQIIIDIPSLNINWSTVYLNLLNASTSFWSIDYSQINNHKVIINLGSSFPIDQLADVSVTFSIPNGVIEGSNYQVKLSASGQDDYCGPINLDSTLETFVHGTPNLKARKTLDYSVIKPGGQINYGLVFTNYGPSVSTNTFIVDVLPPNTTFVSAVTSGLNTNNTVCNGQQFNCKNCKVYFADNLPSLPTALNPANPFTPSRILSNFILGNEDPVTHTWTKPAWVTNPKYIAYLVDDSLNTPKAYNVWEMNCVGLKVKDNNSSIGSLIVNSTAILSDQNLQSISNQVQTTILETPGLNIQMNSNPEVYINACKEFDWIVNYTNDASSPNYTTRIRIKLPNTVTYLSGTNSLTHVRNTDTLLSGVLPTGIQDIHNSPSVTSYPWTGADLWYYILEHNVTNYKGSINWTWSGSYLYPGQGGQYKIRVKSNCNLAENTIITAQTQWLFTNPISIGEVSASDPVTIKNPDLLLNKLTSQNQVLHGEEVVYTLQVSNEWDFEAEWVTIKDTLPQGICRVTWSSITLSAWFDFWQPNISGDCLVWGQELLRTLNTSIYGTGKLWAKSNIIQLSYKWLVDNDIPVGTVLMNLAQIKTSTPWDPGENNFGGICTGNVLSGNMICPNSDSVAVILPLPDPYTQITAPTSLAKCGYFDYTLKYGNRSRTCVEKTFSIFTVPVHSNGGYSSIPVYSAVSTRVWDEIYYHTCPYVANEPAPDFDWDNPTNYGWTATLPDQTSNVTKVCYVAIRTTTPVDGRVCLTDWPTTVTISTQAKDPVDNTCTPPGTTLTGASYTSGQQDDFTWNNYEQTPPRVPTMDLQVDILASTEWSYPGLIAWDLLNYIVNFSNPGTQLSCNNFITVTLSPWVEFDPSSYSSLQMEGLVDPGWSSIWTTPLVLNDSYVNGSWETVLTFTFGSNPKGTSPAGNPNICIPDGYSSAFALTTTVKQDTPDGTAIIALTHIGEDGLPVEDIMTNNDDSTQTTARKPNLVIRKTGISDSNNNSQFTGADSDMITSINENIRYKIEYNNLGNISAEDSEILEEIPLGTCFKLGSISWASLGSVSYSTDGFTFGYIPLGANWTTDCSIRKIKVTYAEMRAPANLVHESAYCSSSVIPRKLSETLHPAYNRHIYGSYIPLLGDYTDVVAQKMSALYEVPETWQPDFNNDGIRDMVKLGNTCIWCTTTQNTYVYLGTATGEYTIVNLGSTAFYGGTVADFNNDGNLDIVGYGYWPSPTRIYFGDGNGGFTSNDIVISNVAWGNAWDLDHDGDIDIVWVGYFPNQSFLGLNDGAGNFSIVNLPSTRSHGVQLKDINWDTHVDIVSFGYGAGETIIYYGDGAGGFATTYPLGQTVFNDGRIVDFNNDGNLDIVGFGRNNNQTIVYYGNGSGGYNSGLQLWITYFFWGEVADMDNDWDIDIIWYGGANTYTKVFLNNWSGWFVAQNVWITNWSHGETMDINNDGNLDIVGVDNAYTSYGDSQVFINYMVKSSQCWNGNTSWKARINEDVVQLSTNTFVTWNLWSTRFVNDSLQYVPISWSYIKYSSQNINNLYDPNNTRKADFNNDGNIDFVGFAGDNTQSIVYYGSGNWNFTNVPLGISNFNGGTVADFNNDGNLDIVGYGSILNSSRIYLWNNSGWFSAWTIISGTTIFQNGYAADFNNDGNLDIVGFGADNNASKVWIGNGSGNFSIVDLGSTSFIGGSVADFDGDGNLDIVGYGKLASQTIIFMGDGLGWFIANNLWLTSFYQGTVADFDGDGNLDIVGYGRENNQTIVYKGDGAGGFTSTNLWITKFVGGTVADFNNDGNLDIVGYGIDSNPTIIYIGNGAWGFSWKNIDNNVVHSNFHWGSVADFDGDGNLDIVGYGRNLSVNGDTKVYFGDGNGNFVATHLGATNFVAGLVADFDNNGYEDIVWFWRTSTPTIAYINQQGKTLSGSYQTIVNTNGLTNWDKLIVNDLKRWSSTISYSIYANTCGGSPILGFENRSVNGNLDISSISPSIGNLCIKVNMTGYYYRENPIFPSIDDLIITYKSSNRPYFNFDVKVQSGVTLSGGEIPNIATISTISPESSYDDNSDDHLFTITNTDLQIDKQVDKTATSSGEILTYTLEYRNNGPTPSAGTITDILPLGVQYQSAIPSPASITSGGRVLQWNIGVLPVGSGGMIIISGLVATGEPNTILTNSTLIASTGYCETVPNYILVPNYITKNFCENTTNECRDDLDCGTITTNISVGKCSDNSSYGCSDNQICKKNRIGICMMGYCDWDPRLSCNDDQICKDNGVWGCILPSGKCSDDSSYGCSDDQICKDNGVGVCMMGYCDWDPRLSCNDDQICDDNGVGPCILPSVSETQIKCVPTQVQSGFTQVQSTGLACHPALLETNLDNNSDKVTSVLGDYAGVSIIIDQPNQACMMSEFSVNVTYTSNGNMPSDNVSGSIILPLWYNFVGLSGQSSGWVYDTGSHSVQYSTGQLSSGYVASFDIIVQITDYNLVDQVQIINWIISTSSDEFDYSDNTSLASLLTPKQCWFAMVDWYIYWDVNQNSGDDGVDDPQLANINVFLSGTDIYGNIVNLSTITDSQGYYFFANLNPGNYIVSYTTGTWPYIPFTSTGWVISGANTSGAIWSLQWGPAPTLISSITLGENQISTHNDFWLLTNSTDFDTSITKSVVSGYMISGWQTLTGFVTSGSIITYRLDFVNSWSEDRAVTLIDNLPTGLIYSWISASSVTIFAENILVSGSSTIGTEIVFKDVFITPNTGHYIEYQVTVANTISSGMSLDNTVIIWTLSGGLLNGFTYEIETNTGNNTGEFTVTMIIEPSTIEWMIYLDSNYNSGNDNEPSLSGILVELISWGISYDTTITNSSGYYIFTWLNPWEYSLQYATSSWYMPYTSIGWYISGTSIQLGSWSLQWPINPTIISGIILPWWVNSISNDFGLVASTSIAGHIYLDNDRNGVLIALPDYLLSGIIVNLLSNTGLIIATTTSNSSGEYWFSGLNIWEYGVTYELPVWYDSFVANTWSISWTNIGNVTSPILIENIIVNRWDQSTNNDFGLVVPLGSLQGTIYEDSDKDLNFSSGIDSLLSGIEVVLSNLSGNILFTELTDGSGNYLFTGLLPNTYVITYLNNTQFSAYASFTWSLSGSFSNGLDSQTVVLSTGSYGTNYDFSLASYYDLSVSKTLVQPTSGIVMSGDTVIYRLEYFNSWSSTSGVISDHYSDNLIFVSSSTSPSSQLPFPSNILNWSLSLTWNSTWVIDVEFIILWSEGDSGLNQVQIGKLSGWVISYTGESNTGNNESESPVYFGSIPAYDLSITKLASTWVVLSGDIVNYTLLYSLSGEARGDIQIEDVLPNNLILLTTGTTSWYTTSWNIIIWSGLSVASNWSGVLTISAQYDWWMTGTITNRVMIGTSGNIYNNFSGESNTGNNVSTVSITGTQTGIIVDPPDPITGFDLAINKEINSSGPYSLNDTISYTISIFNSGNISLSGAQIYDTLSSWFILQTGSVVFTPGVGYYVGNSGNMYEFHLSGINNNQTITLSYDVVIATWADSTGINIVSVLPIVDTGITEGIPYMPWSCNPGNNPIVWDYAVSSTNNTDCEEIVRSNIPTIFSWFGTISGIIYQDINNNQLYDNVWDWVLSGITVHLYSGEVIIQTTMSNYSWVYLFTGLDNGIYSVRYDNSSLLEPSAANTGTNGWTTSGLLQLIDISLYSGNQNSSENNFGLTEQIMSEWVLNLSIVKSVNIASIVAWGSVVRTIQYGNYSNVTGVDVVIRDILPEGLAFISATHGWVFSGAIDEVLRNIGTLNPGETGNVSLTTTVTGEAGSSILNQTIIYGSWSEWDGNQVFGTGLIISWQSMNESGYIDNISQA